MNSKRQVSGFILMELLVGSMLALIVMTALLAMVRGIYGSQETVMSQNLADSTVRGGIDNLIDNLRAAQNNASNGNSVFAAAAPSDVTLYQSYYDYSTSPPTLMNYTIRYWLDAAVSPNVLKQAVVRNGVTTTTMVALGVSSLTLTYYTSGGVYNATAANWVTTANPNSPTAAELPQIGAVRVAATVTTWDGYTRTLTALVRLTNSPYVPTH